MGEPLTRFRDKLDRELKAGLVGLILLATIDRTGPAYGYKLLQTIRQASGDRLQFKEGTAYPLLARLEKSGLVTSFWGAGEAGPPRKYYQATADGRTALAQALADWKQLVAGVDQLLHHLHATEESP